MVRTEMSLFCFMPDPFIALIALSSLLVSYAAIRRALHGLHLVEFFRTASSRPFGGNDLILFSVGLGFGIASLITFAAAFHLPFTNDEWYLLTRRNINWVLNVLLAVWLINGRLVTRIYQVWERHGQ